MPPSQPGASRQLVDHFGNKIEDALKSGRFSSYGSGDEISFIDDTVELLDGQYAYDGRQVMNVKCKKVHASPKVEYPAHKKHSRTKVELADLLVVLNFWDNRTVDHRRAFFSQSKSMEDKKTGYLWWEVKDSQFKLLDERPKFELEHNQATATHDLSESSPSFFNYSFVSDVHRPFFYRTHDMDEFRDNSYKIPRFYYGQNPPPGNRYMFTVLKNTVRGRYGAQFSSGDSEYKLLEEVYEHASLNKSTTPNSVPMVPDGGHDKVEFGIVNIDVDTDGSLVELPSDLRLDGEEETAVPQGLEEDIAEQIRAAFRGLDSEGLHFDGI